jgi:hypothetical protein
MGGKREDLLLKRNPLRKWQAGTNFVAAAPELGSPIWLARVFR